MTEMDGSLPTRVASIVLFAVTVVIANSLLSSLKTSPAGSSLPFGVALLHALMQIIGFGLAVLLGRLKASTRGGALFACTVITALIAMPVALGAADVFNLNLRDQQSFGVLMFFLIATGILTKLVLQVAGIEVPIKQSGKSKDSPDKPVR